MTLTYSFATGYTPTPEKLAACDQGFKAFRRCLIITARHVSPVHVPLVWLLTRFYRRELADDGITYTLYLLKA